MKAALAALDPDALARDVAGLVRIPSVTGDERAALEYVANLAEAAGLVTDLQQHDLAALRAHPGHPGEEAPRAELLTVTATLPRPRPAPPRPPTLPPPPPPPPAPRPGRLCLNGHVDVVSPGTEPWRLGPWSGAIEHGRLHGRGSVDIKGPVVASLHALVVHLD